MRYNAINQSCLQHNLCKCTRMSMQTPCRKSHKWPAVAFDIHNILDLQQVGSGVKKVASLLMLDLCNAILGIADQQEAPLN